MAVLCAFLSFFLLSLDSFFLLLSRLRLRLLCLWRGLRLRLALTLRFLLRFGLALRCALLLRFLVRSGLRLRAMLPLRLRAGLSLSLLLRRAGVLHAQSVRSCQQQPLLTSAAVPDSGLWRTLLS